jgi:hypothetical protein
MLYVSILSAECPRVRILPNIGTRFACSFEVLSRKLNIAQGDLRLTASNLPCEIHTLRCHVVPKIFLVSYVRCR